MKAGGRRWLTALSLAGASAAGAEPVPFVGCAQDGQVGPRPAPRTGAVPQVPPEAVPHVAFYASAHFGVLAPRGWHCFALRGSNGDTLIVTPGRHDFESLRGEHNVGGPAVKLSYRYGGTSGRFSVVTMIARFFPDYRPFVARLDRRFSLGDLPAGPDEDDHILRRTATEVEFRTPAGRDGLGTDSLLVPGSDPVEGLIVLLPKSATEIDLLRVDARLPPALAHLAPVLFEAARRTYGNPGSPVR